jgi:hypothetical protein
MAKKKKTKSPLMVSIATKKPAMKTERQVVEVLQDRFRFAYQSPLMVGRSVEGPDLVLLNDHQLWAEILGR